MRLRHRANIFGPPFDEFGSMPYDCSKGAEDLLEYLGTKDMLLPMISSKASVEVAHPNRVECDLSAMTFFTPRLYCQLQGVYLNPENDEGIKVAEKKWEEAQADYSLGLGKMPEWILDYAAKCHWLHNSKVEIVNYTDKDDVDKRLETLILRLIPDKIHGEPTHVITYKAVWINTKRVLPVSLCRDHQDGLRFLHDEFNEEPLVSAIQEYSYHFFLNNGVEYDFDGLTSIQIEYETPDGDFVLDTIPVSTEKLKEIAQEPEVIDVELEEIPKKRKRKKGRGANGKRLFTFFYSIRGDQYCDQVKSQDWTTVWTDFQSFVKKQFPEMRNVSFGEGLAPFATGLRNIFVGSMSAGTNEAYETVYIVNTKQGKPPGAEEWEDSLPLCANA